MVPHRALVAVLALSLLPMLSGCGGPSEVEKRRDSTEESPIRKQFMKEQQKTSATPQQGADGKTP
jgi:hypothetical protein